jgi:hypothetical protein
VSSPCEHQHDRGGATVFFRLGVTGLLPGHRASRIGTVSYSYQMALPLRDVKVGNGKCCCRTWMDHNSC